MVQRGVPELKPSTLMPLYILSRRDIKSSSPMKAVPDESVRALHGLFKRVHAPRLETSCACKWFDRRVVGYGDVKDTGRGEMGRSLASVTGYWTGRSSANYDFQKGATVRLPTMTPKEPHNTFRLISACKVLGRCGKPWFPLLAWE